MFLVIFSNSSTKYNNFWSDIIHSDIAKNMMWTNRFTDFTDKKND